MRNDEPFERGPFLSRMVRPRQLCQRALGTLRPRAETGPYPASRVGSSDSGNTGLATLLWYAFSGGLTSLPHVVESQVQPLPHGVFYLSKTQQNKEISQFNK